MSTVGYLMANDGSMTVIVDGSQHNVSRDHVNYDKIVSALKSKNYNLIHNLLDIPATIKAVSYGKVTVINGSVYYNGKGVINALTYNGKEVINALTDRIVRFVQEGLPFEPMVSFLENLLSNPSRTAVQELYLFLEQNRLPITEDGYLLAYRKVDDNYYSFHPNPDGTRNRNMVGDVVEMERNEVDDVRERTCSEGLHFCSLEYIPCYHGGMGRVMIVKINPADVVSIPSDYNNSKGRCCRYEVIAEHTDPEKEYKDYTDSVVTASDGGEYGSVTNEPDYETEFCDECGDELDNGECLNCDDMPEDDIYADEVDLDPNDEPVTDESTVQSMGRDYRGNNYHNVRDEKGRFIPKSKIKINFDFGVNDSKTYHNVRDEKGRFVKRS